MTAGADEVDGATAVGYNGNSRGRASASSATRSWTLAGPRLGLHPWRSSSSTSLGEWVVPFAFTPTLDRRDLGLMTPTVDGETLRVSDALTVGDHAADDSSLGGVQ